ncbi:hypothetical protein [Demequina soli]|uniref:hypothetical protein n=1 Tax=Demequina soli TaxID=1638987 RepID=UPI0007832EF4|nr:hypothetical protein [Demequina soli]
MTVFYPEGPEPESTEPSTAPALDVPAAPVPAAPAPASPALVPAGPAPATTDVASPGARRPRRRGLAIAGIASGAVVLALGAGAAYLYTNLLHGAASPQGAVERLVGGAVDGDLLAMGAAIAPSERDLLLEVGARMREVLEASVPAPEASPSAEIDLSGIVDTVSISVSGLEYVTENIADGVAAVRVERGVIEADVDKARFVDAVMVQVEANVSASAEQLGYDEAMVERQTADARAGIEMWVDETFPWKVDIADVVADLRASGEVAGDASPITFMTVEEGGWFVSPMLTVVEAFAATGLETAERGTEVVDALEFATPDDAVAGTADALEAFMASGDTARLAEVLPLPERRIVSLYGEPAIDADGGWKPSSLALDLTDVAVSVDGDLATAELRAFGFAFDDGVAEPVSGSYAAGCFTPDGAEADQLCFADVPILAGLAIDGVTVSLVREGDGWLTSASLTVVDYATRVSSAFAAASTGDTLDSPTLVW